MVRWLHGMLPHGKHLMMWWPEVLPCHLYPADMCRFAPIVLCRVSLSGEVAIDVDQWVSATWHVVGPTSSWILSWRGPPVLTWTNMVVTRGRCLLTWPTLVLPRGTPSLLFYSVFSVLLIPSLHPKLLLSPSCTQDCLDQISALDQFLLIYFYFSEFILIAQLVQKIWNFHKNP
jgi:hypothetical protein